MEVDISFIYVLTHFDKVEDWVLSDDITRVQRESNKTTFDNIEKILRQEGFKVDTDIVYFRAAPKSKELLNFVKIYPTVIEHNSKYFEEMQSIYDQMPFPKNIIAKFVFYPSQIKKRRLWKLILQQLCGGAAITKELGEYQKENSGKANYPYIVIGNGANFEEIKLVKKNISTEVVNFVLLAGSYNSWNGIERIHSSVETHNDLESFKVHVVGHISESKKQKFKHKNIFYYSGMYGDELSEFLGSMHCGLGTMALYKKNMEEACSLKVREYFASGLLCVNGCIDPDISFNEKLKDFNMQVPNNESALPLPKMVEFVKIAYEKGATKQKIRTLSKEVIDMDVKVTLLYKGLQSLRDNYSRASLKK